MIAIVEGGRNENKSRKKIIKASIEISSCILELKLKVK